jgi:hypothetical protein
VHPVPDSRDRPRPPRDPWSDDEALITDLRAALAEPGRVTDQAREAARAALTWQGVDEELMLLTHDSLFADHSLVRSAGTAPPRVLAFQASGFSLEVELDEDVLTGQLLPGSPAVVEVAGARGTQVRAEADDQGFFTVSGVSGGRVRFSVGLGGQTHTSEWVTL